MSKRCKQVGILTLALKRAAGMATVLNIAVWWLVLMADCTSLPYKQG